MSNNEMSSRDANQAMFDMPLSAPELSKVTPSFYMRGFLSDIEEFNSMYKMPEVRNDLVAFAVRIDQFKSILEEECKEIAKLDGGAIESEKTLDLTSLCETIRVNLADLLGDIIVYCASEAKRWNIPIDRVLNVIMQSNFSKLNPDGTATYDERGKLMKGPNYWKPEEKIAQLLSEKKS